MDTLAALLAARCRPRKGPEHRVSEERAAALLSLLPSDWDVAEDGESLRKTFRFPDYYRTMAFVNALAYMAHAQNHHPDLSVHYDRVIVRYSTHDVGGLSENDFVCAAQAQALADAAH